MTDASVLTRKIPLKCSKEHAFKVFTEMTDLWWPRGHRRTEGAKLVMTTQEDGRLFERAPDGSEWTIGRIQTIEPPNSLTFDWFPGSPNAPTRVEVTFSGDHETSEISIVHTALSADAMAVWPDKIVIFARGWDTVLPGFQDYCASST